MGWKGERGRHSLAARGIPTVYPTAPVSKMSDIMKLNRVFDNLERQNILARANFSCCQSCGGYELATIAEEQNKAGWVFWHQQSEDGLRRTGNVHVYFAGADECDKPPKNAKSSNEIAKIAYREFLRVGLDVEWSGEESNAILLKGLKL